MNAEEFFNKVAEMRKLQKEYFKNRDFDTLKKAKVAEAEVDAEIKRANEKQLKLEL